MIRSRIGAALLAALLAAALLSSRAMVEIHEDAADKLEQAADLALADNWAGAAFLIADVRRSWEEWDLLRSAMADHGPIEEIEAMFAILEVYGANRERVAFAASCRDLSRQMEAMGDAHALKPHNLL